MSTVIPQLPATKWLGYGVDMTACTPLDINSVISAIKRDVQIIETQREQRYSVVDIGGIDYNVPRCVAVAQDVKSSQGTYVTYPSGSDAYSAFQSDGNAAVRYLAISATGTAAMAVRKALSDKNQFAFYSFNNGNYTAGLRNYLDLLNESKLVEAVKALPSPFPRAPSASDINAYKAFFDKFGTHVVINTMYGARFQLAVWADRSNGDVNNNFPRNVAAQFRGIASDGSYDEAVFDEQQYQAFRVLNQFLVSVQGGDPELAKKLTADPMNYELYKEWTVTVSANPDIINFTTSELWVLIRDAADRDLAARANDLQDAFEYIMSSHEEVNTLVVFDIDARSDWAEVGLLTPSASISDKVYSAPKVPELIHSPTKIRWLNRLKGISSGRQIITFGFINDGSPVDFCISLGKGKANIILEGLTFTQSAQGESAWSTKIFYQARVSPVSEISAST